MSPEALHASGPSPDAGGSGTERLAAISIDLDEVPCYAAVHGLGAGARAHGPSGRAIYDRALPRFEEWLGGLGLPATFFVIGRDLARRDAARAIRRLGEGGFEIGNHSAQHPYDLTRRPLPALRAEVEEGVRAIAEVVGVPPRGFRAPGYTIDDRLLGVLQEAGVAYDSSVFPCPAYWGAKAMAIAAYRAQGRPSRSILDHPRVLTAPGDPYRPALGGPFHRRGRPGGPLVELPIGVTRAGTGRLPVIGTSLVLAGRTGARRLVRGILGRPLVNLELHGIDLADATADGLDWLAPHQPDLRVTAREKRATLTGVVDLLRGAGYRFVRLDEAAARLGGDAAHP